MQQQPAELITPLMSSDGGDKKAYSESAQDDYNTVARTDGSDRPIRAQTCNGRPPCWADNEWWELYNMYHAETNVEKRQVLRVVLNAYACLRCEQVIIWMACVIAMAFLFYRAIPQCNPQTCQDNFPCYIKTLHDLAEKAAYIGNNSRCLEGV